ncbi:hypothetical protein BT69DRAFT_460589 [Atractiella rhizophila]|nr:hypothetical protein BT69DRAFT_460589 [Atractiella rhizophila]
MILVDSTRRGKRFPDALLKTVPLWCAVINCTMERLKVVKYNTDYRTFFPLIPPSEAEQICRLLPVWTERLLTSSYPLDNLVNPLTKPLKPIFVSPPSALPNAEQDTYNDCYPIFCTSASRFVHAGEGGLVGDREGGWSYVQGSGDDHEAWADGLTAKLWWEHKDLLLQTDREDLQHVIRGLVLEDSRMVEKAKRFDVEQTKISILLGGSPSPSKRPDERPSVFIGPKVVNATEFGDAAIQVLLPSSFNERMKNFFDAFLPQILDFFTSNHDRGLNIVVLQDEFLDFAIAAALALLVRFYDDKRQFSVPDDSHRIMDKTVIRSRLQWLISSSEGQLNPCRAVLNKTNVYFMSKPRMNHH